MISVHSKTQMVIQIFIYRLTAWVAYIPGVFVFHHTVCWWKVGGELGNLRRDLEASLVHIGCVRFHLWSQTVCRLSDNILNLVHFPYVSHRLTLRRHSHPHTDIQMRPSLLPLPALKSPWHCLFTLHCDSCVCVSVCVQVCRSEEGDIACQVLSRAKLSFLSVITPSYFPGAGCLSVCLSL